MHVGEIPRRNARSQGSATAFIDADGVATTWSEVDDRVNRLANGLTSLGVGRGDRVAILAGNDPRYWEAHFACAKAGFISVPVNPRFGPAELRHVLMNSNPTVTIVDSYGGPMLGNADAAIVGHVVGWGRDHGAALDYEVLLAGSPWDDPDSAVGIDDPVVLGYTSGTTGRPKGAVLTNRSTMVSAYGYGVLLGVGADDRFLACMPAYVFRGGSSSMSTPLVGGCTVVQRFESRSVLDVIERQRITTLLLAPAMIQMLLAEPDIRDRDLTSVRYVWTGAAPIRPDVLRTLSELLPNGTTGSVYGMTEATGIALMRHEPDDEHFERRLASVGRPMTLLDVQVTDPETALAVPTGDVGEIWVRGDTVMSGYWQDDERSVSAFRNGWFCTGDYARFDEDGYLYIVDRRIDIINSGGYNVYTTEVEAAIGSHPDVFEVAVVGVPDERFGEAVLAIVAPFDGRTVTAADVTEWCRRDLAGYKKPSHVVFVDSIPRTPLGKVDKRALVRDLWHPASGS